MRTEAKVIPAKAPRLIPTLRKGETPEVSPYPASHDCVPICLINEDMHQKTISYKANFAPRDGSF